MEVDKGITFSYAVDEIVRFGESVKSVKEEKVDHLRPTEVHFREHVEGGEASKTEGGFLK